MSRIQELDFSVDLLSALLWQHSDATRLLSLFEQKQAWYDLSQTAFWNDWITDVFDLRTANDFGLAVWAIILNIPLVVNSQGDLPGKPIWGYGQYRKNYNNGNFASIQTSLLTTEQRRLVLRLRYFQLTTRATVREINAFFAEVFASFGAAYVNDGLDMTARYVFEFPIPSALDMIFTEYDLLPRPAGVKIDYISVEPDEGWGFDVFRDNFENGNFYHA